MAGNKAKAAIGKWQLGTGKGKTKPTRKHLALSTQHLAKTKTKSKTNRKTRPRTSSKTHRAKARRHVQNSDYQKVTTFPQVKGKVVREVRFSHDDPNNVLAIAFKDRTVLYFDINPEALILPLEVSAHYIGETLNARRSWDGLAGAGKTVFSI